MIWVVSAVFIIFSLNQIDSIVHVDLYNFGLQPSTEWWHPYWFYLRLSLIALSLSTTLSIIAIVLSFAKKIDRFAELKAKRQPKPQLVVREEPKVRDNHMLISCPSCKKVFGKPLVMLNFEGGKTRLVNVCPYCNHTLGSAEKEEKSSHVDFRVPDWKKRRVP